jgi:type II secretory pathway component GspD/PulD (secretin)
MRRAGIGLALMILATAPPVRASQLPPVPPADLPVSRLDPGQGPGAIVQATPQIPRGGELPALPVTQLDDRSRAAELDGPRTLSLTFSEPLPLRDVLVLLMRETPFSVVADETVAGAFSGELKDLTLRQALEAVLFPQGLDYDVHGNVIRVFQRRPRTRIFELDHLNIRRASQRRVRSVTDVSGQAASEELTAATGADLFDEVAAGVSALLSQSGRFHVDPKSGLVEVTDFADRLDQVGVYLDAVHLRATRQVRLQAHVLEVTLNSPTAGGIDWPAAAARAGSAVARMMPGTTAGMRVTDFNALFTALGDQGSVRIVASPQTLAMNNEPAVIRVGTDAVFVVEGATAPGAVSEGLTLTLVPQIGADGIVQLSVSPTYTRRSGEVKAGKGSPVPTLDISEIDSLLRVQEGDTVVVSGLLRDRQETKTATGFTGMFGAQERRIVRSELIVMLTPTVVTPGVPASEGAR